MSDIKHKLAIINRMSRHLVIAANEMEGITVIEYCTFCKERTMSRFSISFDFEIDPKEYNS